MFILIYLLWYIKWFLCFRYCVGVCGRECFVGFLGLYMLCFYRRFCWYYWVGIFDRSWSLRFLYCLGCLVIGFCILCFWNIYEKINFFLLNIFVVEFIVYCIWIFWFFCICSLCINGWYVVLILKGVDLFEVKKMFWE